MHSYLDAEAHYYVDEILFPSDVSVCKICLFQSLQSSSVTECLRDGVTADIGWLPLALLMTYIFFFNLGYGSMIWITVAEILPIHVRYV